MSSLTQFVGGGLVPRSIVRGASSKIAGASNAVATITSGASVSSGVCVANTLKTILSVTGAGCIAYLAASAADATSRSNRIKITLDGVSIYDVTEVASTNQLIMQIIGALSLSATNGFLGVIEQHLFFNNSLLIEYASSLSETDKCNFVYNYYTR